jgi:hypothetical protein
MTESTKVNSQRARWWFVELSNVSQETKDTLANLVRTPAHMHRFFAAWKVYHSVLRLLIRFTNAVYIGSVRKYFKIDEKKDEIVSVELCSSNPEQKLKCVYGLGRCVSSSDDEELSVGEILDDLIMTSFGVENVQSGKFGNWPSSMNNGANRNRSTSLACVRNSREALVIERENMVASSRNDEEEEWKDIEYGFLREEEIRKRMNSEEEQEFRERRTFLNRLQSYQVLTMPEAFYILGRRPLSESHPYPSSPQRVEGKREKNARLTKLWDGAESVVEKSTQKLIIEETKERECDLRSFGGVARHKKPIDISIAELVYDGALWKSCPEMAPLIDWCKYVAASVAEYEAFMKDRTERLKDRENYEAHFAEEAKKEKAKMLALVNEEARNELEKMKQALKEKNEELMEERKRSSYWEGAASVDKTVTTNNFNARVDIGAMK